MVRDTNSDKKTDSSDMRSSDKPGVLTSVWSVFSNVWGGQGRQQQEVNNISSASTTAAPDQEQDHVSTPSLSSNNDNTSQSKSSVKSF